MHARTHAHTHLPTCAQSHTCMHVCMHMHERTHTHTNTHMHTHTKMKAKNSAIPHPLPHFKKKSINQKQKKNHQMTYNCCVHTASERQHIYLYLKKSTHKKYLQSPMQCPQFIYTSRIVSISMPQGIQL